MLIVRLSFDDEFTSNAGPFELTETQFDCLDLTEYSDGLMMFEFAE